ncbi:hypothetical protein I6N95_11535 [Vagococcus sp. BWB3-3]|uniref:Uncharacterized protein n=1 Tax=Vagococcus allomyrinae TaxID=2794353 RepID=A0A940SVA1_9ENTE|nr:hypothetical protein [Vagococcus allomyrinae]MBP1041639.1 hypothetical protein [Vagococcus allomyrinae]
MINLKKIGKWVTIVGLVFLAYILLPLIQLLSGGLIQLALAVLIMGVSLAVIRFGATMAFYGIKGVKPDFRVLQKLGRKTKTDG